MTCATAFSGHPVNRCQKNCSLSSVIRWIEWFLFVGMIGPQFFFTLDLHDLAVVHDDFERAETNAFQHLADLAHDFKVLILGRTGFNGMGHAGTPCKNSCWSEF
jgi:hypothetical protein